MAASHDARIAEQVYVIRDVRHFSASLSTRGRIQDLSWPGALGDEPACRLIRMGSTQRVGPPGPDEADKKSVDSSPQMLST